MTLRKEIEDIIEVNVRYVSNKDGIDREYSDQLPSVTAPQICALFKERLEKANKEVKLLKSYFEDCKVIELHKNDIRWEDIDIDTLITELSGERE